MSAASSIVICPICSLSLTENNNFYACVNNHHFDKARQGYVNLLVVNQKKTANPGDNKEMIQSRMAFLNKGFYSSLATALNQLIPEQAVHILDSGCGEGYYLRSLRENFPHHHYYGVDISKEAIKLASVANKNISWFVGSVVRLPFFAQSLDVITAIFAPHDFNEFHRILGEQGRLIICAPEQNHLIELRNILFATVTSKDQDKMLDLANEHFELERTMPLQYQCKLTTKEDIRHLLTMTPFYFKSSKEQQENLFLLEELDITIDVKFWVFRKNKM
ncbi:MAG: methyltransferase domain-containing protein [Gammaproteobacteria bacterium]|nr:methyltransferase domain-containing protein [Gammaproteobacteria bacterium]